MTSQQAITLLRNLEQSLDNYCELNEEGKAAFNTAITALELFGNSERLPSAQPEQCSDCIANGGDWECDHIHCRKGRLPPAQPEIIHCGDCRHWKNDHLCECLSRYGTFETEIYFYCGFAERQEEGDK